MVTTGEWDFESTTSANCITTANVWGKNLTTSSIIYDKKLKIKWEVTICKKKYKNVCCQVQKILIE